MDSARYIIIETSLFHQDQSMHNNMHLNKCLNWWDHFIFDSWFGFQIGFTQSNRPESQLRQKYGSRRTCRRHIIFYTNQLSHQNFLWLSPLSAAAENMW